MASRNRKYIDIPDHARRDFIKWTVGLGAALGLRPWKVWEVQESVVGSAIAQSSASSPVNRAVHLCAGNGGLAWFTQFWPFTAQDAAGRSMLKPGQGQDQAVGTGDHPMRIGPDAPKWAGKKMTAFLCGTNETHTQRAVTASTVALNVSMFAAVSALQTASPTLVPSIAVTNLPYGAATGAPAVASVANAAGMVNLFNSAASTAGGALVNSGDAALFEAYYKANLALRRAAARPTMTRGFLTGKVAANLLGKNLASQLRPAAADLARYGATGAAAKLLNIANALITTVKAFRLNLTSNIMIPAMLDDPHGAFADVAGSSNTSAILGKIIDTFFADMMAEPDPLNTGLKLGDTLVFTVTGDTYKSPLNPSGWGDGTPGNSNILYVLGAGKLRGGWFGQVLAGGGIETWNPTTGANVAGGTPGPLAAPASAAVLYATAKGDMRRVSDFYRGAAIDGIVVPTQI